MKTCKGCGATKPLSGYYLQNGKPMARCKECVKAAVRKHREENIERVREYDRNRPNAKERNKINAARSRRQYHEDPEYRERVLESKRAWQEQNRVKRACHVITGHAIRDGRLVKQPCEVCGEIEVDAHHDDYSKPLDVRWLCRKHHAEHHRNEREKQRKAGAL
jgi:hypothetical protein